jgi:hypothetical protein
MIFCIIIIACDIIISLSHNRVCAVVLEIPISMHGGDFNTKSDKFMLQVAMVMKN